VSKVFAHMAIVSDQLSNLEVMEKMGINVGRIVYITDSYLDLEKDLERGTFNPLITNFCLNKYSIPEKKRK